MVLYAIVGQQEMIVRRIEATGLVLLGLAGLACAFLPAATLQQRSVVLSRPAATSRASGAWRLWAAEVSGAGMRARKLGEWHAGVEGMGWDGRPCCTVLTQDLS